MQPQGEYLTKLLDKQPAGYKSHHWLVRLGMDVAVLCVMYVHVELKIIITQLILYAFGCFLDEPFIYFIIFYPDIQ